MVPAIETEDVMEERTGRTSIAHPPPPATAEQSAANPSEVMEMVREVPAAAMGEVVQTIEVEVEAPVTVQVAPAMDTDVDGM